MHELYLEKNAHDVQISYNIGGSHTTVVACWTAGQVIELLILHLGHVSQQNPLAYAISDPV